MVRGALVLPHGTGRSVRILVFAKGEKEREAREAGADYVGAEDLAKKITDESWLDFDRVIATPDMMGLVGRLGRVLGPRGLMPNPKLGTVTPDVARAVSENKSGKVEYKVDKSGIIHASVAKALVRRPEDPRQRDGADRGGAAREAGVRQGHLHEEDLALHHDGSGPAHRPGVGRDGRGLRSATVLNYAQKQEQVAELSEKLGRASSVIVADYRGLDVVRR